MLKLILLFFLVIVLIGLGILGLILRGLLGLLFGQRAGERGDERRSRRNFRFGRSTHQVKAPERILACAFCAVHVPESEGVHGPGEFFCCDAHRRAHEEASRQ